jgi:hypothetical protein
MDRPHPIHLVTLALAVLAVGFSFVAMRAALEARDLATAAAGASTGDGSYQAVWELQNALVRAGVIEDPFAVPDDGGEPDGPWARCLTAEEADRFGLSDPGTSMPACDTVEVVEVACPPPQPDAEADDVAAAEDCVWTYRVAGQERWLVGPVHPDDVAAAAVEHLLADGAEDVDRVARGADGQVFLHVRGQGWYEGEADAW